MPSGKMVNPIHLAPGISVYQMPMEKVDEWCEIFKTHGEPFLGYGRVVHNDGGDYHSVVNLDHRRCKLFSTSSFSECHEDDPIKRLSAEVENAVWENIQLFSRHYNVNKVAKNHDIIFLRYEAGDFFKDHNDDSASHPRTISATAYFNDDYDGGEICFTYFDVKYKPKKGDCIIFSSAFPYMHRVEPVINGIRYAAVNWYKYVLQ